MREGTTMQAQWTLVVEGLGRIERAEVQVQPFMLFVGENNSGKSYLASLLWGLASLRLELLPPTSSQEEATPADECERWVLHRFAQRQLEPEYTLHEGDNQLLLEWLNRLLDMRRNFIVSRVFNQPDIKVSRLEINRFRRLSPLKLRWGTLPQANLDSRTFMTMEQGADHVGFNFAVTNGPLRKTVCRTIAFNIAWRLIMDGISQAIPGSWHASERIGDPIYLPASRTGFMLMYKAMVRRQLGQLGLPLESDRLEEEFKLTRPAIKFLELLAVGIKSTEEGAFQEEADLLEQYSLHGRLESRTEVGTNDYQYLPVGASTPLPMALSSSLVTELAPIILILRHVKQLPVLVLEEPEAHLHPRIQRLLAQVLVRLVRKGLKVWVTTHSENFCQQIDNFIKLAQLPNRAEVARQLGYGEQDYLDLSEVSGYQFVNRGAKSIVSELEKSSAGLTMPTFNDELLKLTQQTVFLQRAVTRSEDGT